VICKTTRVTRKRAQSVQTFQPAGVAPDKVSKNARRIKPKSKGSPE
jgi:hypothetical protein